MLTRVTRYHSPLSSPVTVRTFEKTSVGKDADQGEDELVQQFGKMVWHSLIKLDVCTQAIAYILTLAVSPPPGGLTKDTDDWVWVISNNFWSRAQVLVFLKSPQMILMYSQV